MRARLLADLAEGFPNDDALIKLFYLALNNISKRWTMPIRDWKAALNRSAIQFEDRMPNR
jgi:putative transposase